MQKLDRKIKFVMQILLM